MNYLLRYPINFDDVKFLTETSYDYELFNPTVTDNDSGWCDAGTGGRIVTGADRVIFRNVSPQQFTLLKLKYQDRLKLLTGTIYDIYIMKQRHTMLRHCQYLIVK